MSRRIDLEDSDLELLQEALGYMSRRFFDPRDSQAILEIEDCLDTARRRKDPNSPFHLVLPDQHIPLLQRVLGSYSNELDHPSSDASNRARIARMRRLAARLGRGHGLLGALRRWLRLG